MNEELKDVRRKMLVGFGAHVRVEGIVATVESIGTAFIAHKEVPSVLLSDGRRIYGEAVFYLELDTATYLPEFSE